MSNNTEENLLVFGLNAAILMAGYTKIKKAHSTREDAQSVCVLHKYVLTATVKKLQTEDFSAGGRGK